ncbi:hypothetical protein CIW48_08145 [Methylobacterium sp. P1-11]|uniref:hypothetical protein n=1 Tax=Methylobacterium sp. P1-11 TaxID=2024616 RepID=UPI0011F01F40|nr:hypothetical protein [Methylobacterium sp. P1-11]KAA0124288.1 hypothetical protein CIW48_08145 [Methylobacterium sp. P1-11]
MITDVQKDASEVRQRLSEWLTTAEFQAIVQQASEQVGPHTIFRTPAWSFWRDAWIIGRFADLIGADRAQLTSQIEQYPDGRVRTATGILEVEATEALMPGRKRANEYAPDAPDILHDPQEEWDRRLDTLPSVLDRVICKKVGNRYGLRPTLVVYLNIGAYGSYRDAETRTSVANVKERYASSFTSLHVLRGDELL